MAQNLRIVESGIDNGGGRSIDQVACVEKERDHGLFANCCVLMPISERIGLFLATSVGTGGGDGFAVCLNECLSKWVGRKPNAKRAIDRF